MIKKRKSYWVILSETTKRVLGKYRTKREALKRLRQIEYFKHLKGE